MKFFSSSYFSKADNYPVPFSGECIFRVKNVKDVGLFSWLGSLHEEAYFGVLQYNVITQGILTTFFLDNFVSFLILINYYSSIFLQKVHSTLKSKWYANTIDALRRVFIQILRGKDLRINCPQIELNYFPTIIFEQCEIRNLHFPKNISILSKGIWSYT